MRAWSRSIRERAASGRRRAGTFVWLAIVEHEVHVIAREGFLANELEDLVSERRDRL